MADEPQPWRPWRALRDRPDIDYQLAGLPAGLNALWCRDPATGARAILIDASLDPVQRLTVLAHELVHDERGGSGHHPDASPTWSAVVAREEARTDAIAARRLLPATTLGAWVEREVDLGHQVDAEAAAERFEVTVDVARRALGSLEAGAA